MSHRETTVHISSRTMMKSIVVLLVLFFFYLIKEVLAVLFVSLVLAAALDPWIDWLERWKIPRGVGVLVVYLIIVSIIVGLGYVLIPAVTNEFATLTKESPQYYQELANWWNLFQGGRNDTQDVIQNVQSSIQNITPQLFTFAGNFAGGLAAIIGVAVLTFYLTVEESAVKIFVRSVIPTQYQPYTIKKINQIQMKLGQWIRGQLILSLIIAVCTYIGLLIIGVKFALVLALIAGVAELVPFIGPILSAIPSLFFALTDSPLKAILVVILYVVIQQLENNLLVPKVMQKTVGLNPIAVLLVLLIGAKLAGVVGLLLAVPTATIVSIFIEDFIEGKREREERLEL
ncbi:MAG: AI-2E family transporter [Candidatus Kerfeldbacteria bacterium]|nr:AI-2E family transporter [Candidatus Kerfeldbacteria bacterium]